MCTMGAILESPRSFSWYERQTMVGPTEMSSNLSMTENTIYNGIIPFNTSQRAWLTF